MKVHEMLQAVYAAQIAGEEMTSVYYRLTRDADDKLVGVSRSKFDEVWNLCEQYPAKFKLDIITARQNEVRTEVSEAMLKCDPPWEEVVDFCELIRGIQQGPHQLPMALDALAELKPELAETLRVKAATEFPKYFATEAAE